jgi:allantoicase
MIKSSILALLAVAAMGSVAAPAFAAAGVTNDSNHADGNYLDSQSVIARLQEQGVNATSVEHWGTLIRAFVTQPDGTQVSQLFNPDTLKPVTL